MISQRQLFLQYLAQTSDNPLLLEIEKAKGIYIYSPDGSKYIDLISGISVSNVGHCHSEVIHAVKKQLDHYMHLMVYGEFVQSPQVRFAQMLIDLLPKTLNSVYFVNSGSEAVEGALKLAKKYTGRSEVVSFRNAYHGSTHGALSVMGYEEFKNPFRPLLPDIRIITFNNKTDIKSITEKTACVIVEPIQGEAGIILPENNFLRELRNKCDKTGSILIFDEIQTGFGRTGKLFAFQKYNVTPDILVVAKAMGGGMPLGAFIASKDKTNSLKTNPALSHITTFGGHPVSCAAGLASLNIILEENLMDKVLKKEQLFRNNLQHHLIRSVRGVGLLLAVELENAAINRKFISEVIKKGLLTDFFLFDNSAFRISPPLIINEEEINESCNIILETLNVISKKRKL